MKVYVVLHISKTGSHLAEVFNTKESAIKYVEDTNISVRRMTSFQIIEKVLLGEDKNRLIMI